MIGADDFSKHSLIVSVQIQNAYLAAQLRNIFNDFIGLCFTKAEVVCVAAIVANQIDKCFYSERIVLSGNTKVHRPLIFPVYFSSIRLTCSTT